MHCFVWKSILLLSCTLALTPEQSLPLFPLAPGLVQAAEPSNQSPQDGVIKTCTGQRIDLGAPQLTDADLKALTSCSSEVMPQLLEALKSQDWKVKVIAAHTLGLFGTKAKSAIPTLSNLIQGENADIRFAAAQVLGEIGTEAVVPALTKALQDKDENVRVSAADAFQKMGSIAKQAKPVLIDALWDGNWFVRSKVATTLSKLGLESNDILGVVSNLRENDEPGNGAIVSLLLAIYAPASDKLEDSSSFFIQALQNTNPNIREGAAILLGQFVLTTPGYVHLDESSDALIKALSDPDVKVRQQAARALGYIMDGLRGRHDIKVEKRPDFYPYTKELVDIQPALLRSFQDPDPSVRGEVATSLGKLAKFQVSSPDIVLDLLKALREQDSLVRKNSIDALGNWLFKLSNTANTSFSPQLRNQLLHQVSTSLLNSLLDKDTNIIEHAAKALREFDGIGDQSYEREIAKSLVQLVRESAKADVRRSAIYILWSSTQYYRNGYYLNSYSNDTITALNELLKDPDLGVRQQAAIALINGEKIDYQSAIGLFVEGLKSKDLSARLDAMTGLLTLKAGCLRSEEIKGLGGMNNPCKTMTEQLPQLISELKNSVKQLRFSAAITIAAIDPKQEITIPVFHEMLSAGIDKSIQDSAISSLITLAAFKSQDVVSVIISSSSYRDLQVRYARTCNSSGIFNTTSRGKKILTLLIQGLKNENIRSTCVYSLIRFSNNKDTIYKLELLLNQSSGKYEKSAIFRDIFKLKDQDFRRSIIYVLGEIAGDPEFVEKQKTVRILTNILNDQREVKDIQWMAATSLQRMKLNLDSFFTRNNLLNPEQVQCKFPRTEAHYGLSFDRYSGRCFYDEFSSCGDGLAEIYAALTRLIRLKK